MTSADRNDLMPTQKLELVTPKISLMGALLETEGKPMIYKKNEVTPLFGPS
jgi:hypothetical protein